LYLHLAGQRDLSPFTLVTTSPGTARLTDAGRMVECDIADSSLLVRYGEDVQALPCRRSKGANDWRLV
jgi:hypothetical protein